MAGQFKKGHKGGPGRPKGLENKTTRAFKDAVSTVYQTVGGDTAFAKWAKANPTEFYKIAARLIPTETNLTGSLGTYSAREIPVESREPDPLAVAAGAAARGDTQGLH